MLESQNCARCPIDHLARLIRPHMLEGALTNVLGQVRSTPKAWPGVVSIGDVPSYKT